MSNIISDENLKTSPSHEYVSTLAVMDGREAAVYLRTSTSTLAKYRTRGNGPAFIRQSSRKTLYRKADLDAWLVARRYSSTSQETVEAAGFQS